MGEANYYMVVKFEDEEVAGKHLDLIRDFLVDMAFAFNTWQKVRHEKSPVVDRYKSLVDKYRFVMEALHLDKGYPEDDENMNWLAGKLDSPASISSTGRVSLDIELHDNGVCFNGEVWHFADWRGLEGAMRDVFGAKEVGWVSDEYSPGEVYYDQILTK